MTMILQVPAYITKIETTADKGVKLIVHTQELDPSNAAVVFSLKDKYGFFLFKEGQFEESEVANLPDFVPEFKGDKTPSQRLRGVLYRVWEANGKVGAFDSFYTQKMEAILDHFKEKL